MMGMMMMMIYHLSRCFFHNFLLFSQIGPVLVSHTCPGIPTSLPLLRLLTLPLTIKLLFNLQDPLQCHLSIKFFLIPPKVVPLPPPLGLFID